MPRHKLLANGVDELLDQYREEIGEEFGVYKPASSRDILMNPKVADSRKSPKYNKERKENEKEKK
ncbi:hypothetical protein [Pseudalkalibacillus caeni]|uniref:Uncharacterized protein n=1 Tax=Exobacillus caeni TaxID=2574798 RepID=A0A5R9F4B7_9BACL|nr:hypothetical protein [Pseudalkalibacillus caeni]TLS37349.1 hypothetical protein FCL54_09340 [Pseudalkalibacillus caeni]